MPKVLSDRDAANLEAMLRWWRSNTDTRYQRRRRHGRGGGGGGAMLVYCKTDAPDSDEIQCYPRVDLLAWSATAVYALGDWVEVAGVDYKSLEDGNENHGVDTGWWEAGTKSVTVKCLITNGDSLMYAGPRLKKSDPLLVHSIGGQWYADGFNGGTFVS